LIATCPNVYRAPSESVEFEFGLGSATSVDRILVLWPSGGVRTSENIEADQSVLVVELEE